MNEAYEGPYPTEIKLHQRTQVLELKYGDGAQFVLPAEYLRVYSPDEDGEVDFHLGRVPTGKERVAITSLTPVGNHAIRLDFDDGHQSGPYGWGALYELGDRKPELWPHYLQRLEKKGYQRRVDASGGHLNLLYFAKLADRVGRAAEEVDLPGWVTDVGGLLAWLRARGGAWELYLADDQVKVTVNRAFARLDTPVSDGDEVAIVPSHPR
jgi:DUF971 family protein/molybdopterin converting factor small subunit